MCHDFYIVLGIPGCGGADGGAAAAAAGGCVCVLVSLGEQGFIEEEVVEINVKKLTFREANNSQLKAAGHAVYTFSPACSDCRTEGALVWSTIEYSPEPAFRWP